MTTRRHFLRQATLAAGGALLLPRAAGALSPEAAYPEPGLQLFTFFTSIDNDVPGTLKTVRAAGYRNIESAFSRKGGYYGMKPKEWARMLRSEGLRWRAHHVVGAPFRRPGAAAPAAGAPVLLNLTDHWQQAVDEAAEGGVQYLVCASIPAGTRAEVDAALAVLDRTGAAAKKAGIGFAYHNHDREFKNVEGTVPYEAFLTGLDREAVKMELDIAWAVKGGADPVALFNRYPGRFPLWHVKDLDAERKTVMPLGAGTIDYRPFFAAAATAGLKNYFIEHDGPKDAAASIRQSMEQLKKMRIVR